jgi:hypothetical protein
MMDCCPVFAFSRAALGSPRPATAGMVDGSAAPGDPSPAGLSLLCQGIIWTFSCVLIANNYRWQLFEASLFVALGQRSRAMSHLLTVLG